ncbi:MAG: ribosome assembly factor SBDS [Candidatus Aenigmatarchaeota archaeon]
MLDITVSVDKAVVARLQHSGQRFEILVDPEKALEVKKGGKVNIDDLLAYPSVYKDSRKGEAVSLQELQKVFGTTDIMKIAEKIIKEGELQVTTEQRRRMIEQKKIQIANIISKKGINPQTNTPHPPQRIINAMEQAGVNIDPFLEAELQVDKVLKSIKSILPIKFQKVVIQFKIPPQFSGNAYNVFKSVGNVVNEEWLGDGSLSVSVEILAGMQDELFQKISSLTHGNFESKVIKREDV